MTQKIKIHLQPTNIKQPLTPYTLEIGNYSTKCEKLIGFIRKKFMNYIPSDSTIFLYYNRFALYPDTTVQEILDHSPGITEFDINYSLDVQYG